MASKSTVSTKSVALPLPSNTSSIRTKMKTAKVSSSDVSRKPANTKSQSTTLERPVLVRFNPIPTVHEIPKHDPPSRRVVPALITSNESASDKPVLLPPRNNMPLFRKIDFSTVDIEKFYRYALSLAYQELAYRIPVRKHRKKLEKVAFVADQEFKRIELIINPPIEPRRKLGDPVRIPNFEIYDNGLKPNEYFETFRRDLLPPTNYVPDKKTVAKVSEWLERNAPEFSSGTVWLQPLLHQLEEAVEEKTVARRFFNVQERVKYPFYEPTASNLIAERH